MKRSEALNHIIAILARSEAMLFTKVAEDILTQLEKDGMLPPTICLTKLIEENDYCPIDGIITIKSEKNSFKNEWEPEND